MRALTTSPALVVLVQGLPRVFWLKPGQTVTLGREQQNTLVLPDMAVSRQHAEVFPGLDGFYVRDCASGNGVRVNRARITRPYRLAHGDCILIGGISIFFLHQSSASTEPLEKAQDARAAPGCPTCGTSIVRGARYCARCGSPLRKLLAANA